MNDNYNSFSNPDNNSTDDYIPFPNPDINNGERPDINPLFDKPKGKFSNNRVQELIRQNDEQATTLRNCMIQLSKLQGENEQLKAEKQAYEIQNQTFHRENAELLKKLQELQGIQIKDRTDANLAQFNENIEISRSKSLVDANSNALKTIEVMGKEIGENYNEISKLKQENAIYKAREKENNNPTLLNELNKKAEENYTIKNKNEILNSNLKILKATNKELQQEIKATKKELSDSERENKRLKNQIESYNKEYKSTSFFEWLTDPLLSKIEVKRQTKKNEELTKNIDMNTELYKSIFGKFDSYKKNISAWIDNNFKSYCNYINTIADVSEYNKDVIEDLLNLINEMENWVIDLIVEYEKKLKTKKTKTAIKSEVEDEIDDKMIGKKTKARKIPEKPELINPPLPDNLTDAEKLLNAPRESEKRAEPSN